MNDMIPTPGKGQPMTASWAKSVTDVCNGVRVAGFGGTLARDGAGAQGNAPAPASRRDRVQQHQHPFEVRWRSDVGEDGGYAIYLPNDHLLMVDGSYVDIGGVDEIEDVDGWKSIDDASSESTHVWLTISTDDDVVSANVTCSTPSSSEQSICIAELVAPSSDHPYHKVTQSVVGALAIGSSGSSSGEDGEDADLSAYGTVVTSVDYVTSRNDSDYASHAYSIRIKRGRLSYDAATGVISVVEDANLTQFIATTPHTVSMDG